ncbi:transcriptional regulator [Lachnospiraceae bacterium JC7]|nr:transcriptional regulator [Lachnospiraceae bacterium JC7]
MTREERKKEIRIKRTRDFILAARKLMKEGSFEEISVRKIADIVGMHNSTIYLYFPDADRLLTIASVSEFLEYNEQLEELSMSTRDVYDIFYRVWGSSCLCSFRKADIFYNFFYGKYSDDLTDIMKEYYELFPEENKKHSEYLENMYFGKNIKERCLELMKPLVDMPHTKVTEENIKLINDVIVYSFRGFLYKAKTEPSIPAESLATDFVRILHMLVDE